jgi:hypothetical protein
MLVHRADLSAVERHHFEEAIRASGRDPRGFSAELFETTLAESGAVLRRVHVIATSGAAAQYEASGATDWTGKFARHLESGIFG